MKVTFENGVLTVKTGIKEDAMKKLHMNKVNAKDKNGDTVFAVALSNDASISKYGLNCNQTIDGELAVVMAFSRETVKDTVIAEFGDALLSAKQYLPQIAEDMATKAADLASIFGADAATAATEAVAQ